MNVKTTSKVVGVVKSATGTLVDNSSVNYSYICNGHFNCKTLEQYNFVINNTRLTLPLLSSPSSFYYYSSYY